jgi:hypothetical protein
MGTVPLSQEQRIILTAATMDKAGEYCLFRDYNKPWDNGRQLLKDLEEAGFMKIKAAGRVADSNRWSRCSVITDAGRAALAETVTAPDMVSVDDSDNSSAQR